MRLLSEGDFVSMDEHKHIHLTELGREVAETVYERHCVLTEGLIALGVDPKIAEQDACRIEHDLSKESFEKLKSHWEKYRQRVSEYRLSSGREGDQHAEKSEEPDLPTVHG